jgi:hypothetical protein
MAAALYEHYGRWQRVANACSKHGAAYHSAGYYQQIATGRIKTPDDATSQSLACVFSAFSAPRRIATRRGLAVSPCVFDRLESAKIARAVTWDALLERAATLLEEEAR